MRGHGHRLAHPLAGQSGERAVRFVHGMCRTPTHNAWIGMRQRCSNPKHPRYRDYGGRGITVCERWLTFASFLEDMGVCPPGLSLDRVNNDGNYESGNCRWATVAEQNSNKRAYRNGQKG